MRLVKLLLVAFMATTIVASTAGVASAQAPGNYGYINYDYQNSNAHVSMWLHVWNAGNDYTDGNWKFVQNNQSNITKVQVVYIILWRNKCDENGNNCNGWTDVEESNDIGVYNVGADNVVGPFDTGDSAFCGISLIGPKTKYHVEAKYKFYDAGGWQANFRDENSNDFVIQNCGPA